mgnify:CR=1 FL=1
MMRIDIISVIPALMHSFFDHSICKRAVDAGLIEIVFHDLHDFSLKKQMIFNKCDFMGMGVNRIISFKDKKSLLSCYDFVAKITFSICPTVWAYYFYSKLSL